jgi:hypothetical protein
MYGGGYRTPVGDVNVFAGEEYMAYNVRRWGSDGWTQALRSSGAKDGATFSNWKWWPNTLKVMLMPFVEHCACIAQLTAVFTISAENRATGSPIVQLEMVGQHAQGDRLLPSLTS